MNRGTNTQFFQPQGKTTVERPLQRPPTKVWSLTKCERASEKNHQHRGMRSRAKAGEERTKEPSVHAKWKVREGRHSMPRIMNTRQRTPTKIPGPRQERAKRTKGTKGPRGPKSRAVRQTDAKVQQLRPSHHRMAVTNTPRPLPSLTAPHVAPRVAGLPNILAPTRGPATTPLEPDAPGGRSAGERLERKP